MIGHPENDIEPLVDLSFNDMVPPPELFLHPSTLHGQAHVARVMTHATVLAHRLGMAHQRKRLWAGVYLHDIARHHDGICYEHGARAVTRYETLEEVRALFERVGITDADMHVIRTAVTHHCKPQELDRTHPHWELTALLKDADGLDRVRLGDLDVRYLRHEGAKECVGFAEALFARTAHFDEGADLFDRIWREAGMLLEAPGKPV